MTTVNRLTLHAHVDLFADCHVLLAAKQWSAMLDAVLQWDFLLDKLEGPR